MLVFQGGFRNVNQMFTASSEGFVAQNGVTGGPASGCYRAKIGRNVPPPVQIRPGCNSCRQNFAVSEGDIMYEPDAESQQEGWNKHGQILPVGLQICIYAPEKILQSPVRVLF